MNNYLEEYQGKKLQKPRRDYDENGLFTGKTIAPYIPDEHNKLIDAVKYARLLNRPLLIRGEPGCGKTRLAQAVAYELYGPRYRKYYFEWFIKSTEKATDGLYTFDHLARLRDVQEKDMSEQSKEKYLTYGPMGKAYLSECPAILLIDEIDKANIDFPNDLLLELDQKRFNVKELDNKEIKAKHPPIVFITSNDERELPNAFLRRCVFHYIKMDKDTWLKIVKAHFPPGKDQLSEKTLNTIVGRFDELVTKMKNGNATKTPDTSELLDWAHTIHHFWLKGNFLSEEDIQIRLEEKGILDFSEVLLKTLEDRQQFSNVK
jgi:MoxR-like ATPase